MWKRNEEVIITDQIRSNRHASRLGTATGTAGQRQQPGEITKGDSKITEETEGCELAKLSMEVIKSTELGVEQARGGRRGLGGRSMAHAA
jgi:hypothetical protein